MNDDEKLFQPRFTLKDVTIHDKRRAYKGFFAIDRYDVSYERFDGTHSKILGREIFERDQDAVAILPYDPVADEVLFIEQFRPGALKDEVSPWLIEIIAGMIDAGETPEQAALRELNEEGHLSLTRDHLHYVTFQYPSPGGCSEKVTIYIADVDLSHIDSHGGLEVESEDLRIFKSSTATAFRMVEKSRVCNAVAIIALMYLQLHHDKVRAQFMKNRA